MQRKAKCAFHSVIVIQPVFYLILFLFFNQVDIKCNTPGSGGFYYSEHLRKVGEPVKSNYKAASTKRNIVQEEKRKEALKIGDKLRVGLPLEEVISLNMKYGWTQEMGKASAHYC